MYRVVSGEVYAFVAPLDEDSAPGALYPGRKVYFCTVKTGEVIPSLLAEVEGRTWCMVLLAQEEATLEYAQGAAAAAQREVYHKNNRLYQSSGGTLEEYLAEYYLMQMVSEERFIYQRKTAQEDNARDSLKTIWAMFAAKHTGAAAAEQSKNALYNAAAALCGVKEMQIAPYKTISDCTRRHVTVESIARISHFLCRKIDLAPDWRTQSVEPMLAWYDGAPVVLQKRRGKYRITDPAAGTTLRADDEAAVRLSKAAYVFYRPLPERALTFRDLLRYAAGTLRAADVAWVVALAVAGVLVGLLLPTLNQWIYDTFIPMGRSRELAQLGFVILACTAGNLCFTAVKNLTTFRLNSSTKYDVQAAVFDRLFNMPASFLARFSSADLAQRVLALESAVYNVGSAVFGSFLSAAFSLLYIFKMFSYSKRLGWIGVVMVLLYGGIQLLIYRSSIQAQAEYSRYAKQGQAQMYEYLSGIAKLRVSGTESTAVNRYIKTYSKQVKAKDRATMRTNTAESVNAVVQTVFSMVLYYIVVRKGEGISLGAFMGFNTAFSSFVTAVLMMMNGVLTLLQLEPEIKEAAPLLENTPEGCEGKTVPASLGGEIEIDGLTFGYDPDRPVLHDISIHIRSGDYVAFVGPSGSGKSTLLKLLLGFESPNEGKIYYDQRDLDNLEKREFRKHCGVVLQNGQLVPGSIFENITIATPNATQKQVDEVLEAVGLKQDVADMPMGVHTMVAEGAATISGGQRQRMLIARAIINKPQLLFLDEATSALDNITQAKVCESLDKLRSTRVVIAHRLSTVMHCDRIYVMDGGRIVEQGDYESLMEQRGLFYRMAQRQLT